MWLKLTTVKFVGSGNKQKSFIVASRVNFDFIESYSEAPEDVRNHKSIDARAETLLYLAGANNLVYHVKETVEQIDDLIAAYGSDNVETPINPFETLEEKTEKLKEIGSDWGNKSGW